MLKKNSEEETNCVIDGLQGTRRGGQSAGLETGVRTRTWEKRLDLTHGVNLLDRVLATTGSGASLVGRAGCDKVRRWECWGGGERWQGHRFTSASGPPSVSRDQRISVLKCDTQRLNVWYKCVANI